VYSEQVQTYLQECERRAAVVIQSFWRGFRERRRYNNTLRFTLRQSHTQQQAARTLQRAVGLSIPLRTLRYASHTADETFLFFFSVFTHSRWNLPPLLLCVHTQQMKPSSSSLCSHTADETFLLFFCVPTQQMKPSSSSLCSHTADETFLLFFSDEQN